MSEKKEYIRIRGAREHNLKNINIDIPRNEFVVLTGLQVLVSLHWHLIRFMRRDREDIWSHCLRMQDSS